MLSCNEIESMHVATLVDVQSVPVFVLEPGTLDVPHD